MQTAWLLKEGRDDKGQATQVVDGASKLTRTVMSAKHDAMGNQTQTTDAAGRRIHSRFASNGNWMGIEDGRGFKSQKSINTEGQTLMAGLYLPNQTEVHRASYYWQDELNRPVQTLMPDGRLDVYTYGKLGQIEQHQQSHGEGSDILHTYRTNAAKTARAHIAQTADGWVRVNVQTKNGLQASRNKASTLINDFGQVLTQPLPHHGTKTAAYDEAGRITQITSADQSSVVYQYDSQGRLTTKSHKPKPDAPTQPLATMTYEGALLKSITDPAQTTTYQYDALGRKVGEQIKLAALQKDSKESLPFETQTRLQATTGLASSRTLFDGRVLRTERSSAQDGLTAKHLTLQSAWAAALHDAAEEHLYEGLASIITAVLPSTKVASDIQVHPFNGLTSYASGNGITTAKQFDLAGRLTKLETAKVSTLTYRYGVGPRVMGVTTDLGSTQQDQPFNYVGFGRLKLEPPTPLLAVSMSLAGQNASTTRMEQAQSTLVDALGRAIEDEKHSYTYTASGQLETVTFKSSNQLVAKYSYNSLNQRVSKTTYAARPEPTQGQTTYFLWQHNKVVAEMNPDGKITAQYIYLNEGQHATPIAKIESGDKDRILFIHADHRATPTAMTDASQKIVWRADVSAWGVAKTSNTAVLNLRLPGQYFDAEKGLHDNLHRTYNPQTGRYLTPDPLGLYEIDIHYYMTFFLALSAGLDYKEARTIALAAQYVDHNPMTRPVDDASMLTILGSAFQNHQQLLLYHFTLSDNTGHTIGQYANTNVTSVVGNLSPQLQNLKTASDNAPTKCAKFQFLGEFIHAFSDTFSHRDAYNDPYDAFNFLGIGVGHGLAAGSQPDYTWSHTVTSGGDPLVDARNWMVRPDRTLAAEQAVFNILKGYGNGNGVDFAEIEPTLKLFNSVREDGSDGPGKFTEKKSILETQLKKMIRELLITPSKNGRSKAADEINLFLGDGYKNSDAAGNRVDFLGNLSEANYPGVCLPGGTRCVPF